MGMDLGFILINKMNHQHEREGIVTLTEHNIMPVDAFRIAEEYRVGTNRWDNGQDKLDGIILTNGMIEDRCAKLAYDLQRDYGNNRIHLLCVLKVPE